MPTAPTPLILIQPDGDALNAMFGPAHEARQRDAGRRQLLTPDPSNPSAPSAPCYDCRTTGERLAVQEDRLQILSDTMRRIVAEIDQRLDALEAAATPAIANREWMTATEGVLNQIEARLVALEAAGPAVADGRWMAEIERRLDALEAHAVETDDTLSILDGRVTNDAIAGVERLQALEKRWDFLSQQFLLVMQRVDAGLPGADYIREQYDAEHDAAPISYWDMKLLAMIETVNERLGVAVGGA